MLLSEIFMHDVTEIDDACVGVLINEHFHERISTSLIVWHV